MPQNDAPRFPVQRSDGKIVHVTVPENDEEDLFDAVREQLSPHAVATIISYLQPARTNSPEVDREVAWFREQLFEMLGETGFNEACKDLGL